MEKEKPEIRNRGVGLIIILASLIIVILGLTSYIIYEHKIISKQNSNNNQTIDKNIDTKKEKNTSSKKEECPQPKVVRGINTSDCINNKNYDYSLVQGSNGLNFTLNQTNNSVDLYVNWEMIKRGYGIDIQGNPTSNYTINNFSGKVVDMLEGGIGQDATGTLAIFLLEDGTIEYIPLYEALKNQNIKSYGKVAGVEDIIKLYSSTAAPKDSPVGAYVTILAQKSDGTFYNLQDKIKF